MATAVMGLDQFQRFLPCDHDSGLHTCDLGIELHSHSQPVCTMGNELVCDRRASLTMSNGGWQETVTGHAKRIVTITQL